MGPDPGAGGRPESRPGAVEASRADVMRSRHRLSELLLRQHFNRAAIGRRRGRMYRLHEGIRPPTRRDNATNDFQREIAISNSLSNSGTYRILDPFPRITTVIGSARQKIADGAPAPS